MNEIEIERRFLLKFLPDISQCSSKKLVDIYIPKKEGHAAIRVRQQGEKFFITKKTSISKNELKEETMQITEEEFEIFKSMTKAKIIEKTRYFLPAGSNTIEIDIFQGLLSGLAIAEIEFNSMEELHSSSKPDFCLTDISDQEFLAGGLLCGKTYKDLEPKLLELGYQKIG